MATKAKTKSTESLRTEVRETLTELEALRNDLQVRTHLAGMDLKRAWDQLDPKYVELRDAARDAKDEALQAIQHGLVGVRRGLHALREKLDTTDGG